MIPFLSRTVPIPPRLYDSTTGAPFERCVVCERSLLDGDAPYVVEQAVRRVGAYDATDVVFAYAMCLPCQSLLWEQLSPASQAAVEAHFGAHLDVHARLAPLLENTTELNVARWLGACALTGQPIEALDEYQIVAHCHGDRLVLSHLPCLFSGAAMDAVASLLSPHTKDELGGFVDRFLGPPPALRKLLTERGVVLL